MKKIILVLLVITLALSLFSCSSSTFNNAVTQLEELYWQSTSLYTNEQIAQIESSFDEFGLSLTGEIESIAHFIKPQYPESIWVYVYEFENESDALSFKKSYADSWGNAKISGSVVVYSNDSEIINDIQF